MNITTQIWLLRIVGVSEIFIGGINLYTLGSPFISVCILVLGILCLITAERITDHG
jgi:hypothetical protein